jgi:hypothetical protein
MPKNKPKNARDAVVFNYFSKMGKQSYEARRQKYGDDYMKKLSEKSKASFRKKRGVVNEEHPEKNCPICGFDHAFMTDLNRKSYGKAHAKYIKKQTAKKAREEKRLEREKARAAREPKPIVIIEDL